MPNDKVWEKILYEYLSTHLHPEKEVKAYASKLSKEYSTKDWYTILVYAYTQLMKDQNDTLANYIYELYAYGIGKKYFEKAKVEAPKEPVAKKQPEVKKDMIAEMVNFDTIVNHCLIECVNYSEIKPVYDMLLELLYGVTDERWLDAKKKIHDRMVQMEKKLNITVEEGGELNLEKKVEYEVGYVDAGGTGIKVEHKNK